MDLRPEHMAEYHGTERRKALTHPDSPSAVANSPIGPTLIPSKGTLGGAAKRAERRHGSVERGLRGLAVHPHPHIHARTVHEQWVSR